MEVPDTEVDVVAFESGVVESPRTVCLHIEDNQTTLAPT